MKIEQTAEDQFRASLEDVLVVLKKLAPKFSSIEDLGGAIELALTNSGQLNLLLDLISPMKLRN